MDPHAEGLAEVGISLGFSRCPGHECCGRKANSEARIGEHDPHDIGHTTIQGADRIGDRPIKGELRRGKLAGAQFPLIRSIV